MQNTSSFYDSFKLQMSHKYSNGYNSRSYVLDKVFCEINFHLIYNVFDHVGGDFFSPGNHNRISHNFYCEWRLLHLSVYTKT